MSDQPPEACPAEGTAAPPGQAQPVITSVDRYWAQQALLLEQQALPTIRAQADKWRAGLTGLTGVVAAVLAVGTPFVGQRIGSTEVRSAVTILMIAGLVALLVASWRAMKAAFGVASTSRTTGPDLQRWAMKAAIDAKGQIAQARSFTLVGLVALVAAAAVGLIGTQPPQSRQRVGVDGGNLYCGTVSYASDGAVLTVVAQNGKIYRAPVAHVVELDEPGSC